MPNRSSTAEARYRRGDPAEIGHHGDGLRTGDIVTIRDARLGRAGWEYQILTPRSGLVWLGEGEFAPSVRLGR